MNIMQRAQPSAFLIVRIFCPPSESNVYEAHPPHQRSACRRELGILAYSLGLGGVMEHDINITSDMIQAGIQALYRLTPAQLVDLVFEFDDAEIVSGIYKAMRQTEIGASLGRVDFENV